MERNQCSGWTGARTEAIARLETLESAFDDPHHNLDIYDEVSADFDAVTSAIGDLRPIAKRDLART
jgi:hypothetical protein